MVLLTKSVTQKHVYRIGSKLTFMKLKLVETKTAQTAFKIKSTT
jgi:hypothetical protein